MKPLNNEAIVYEAVRAGMFQIDPNGAIWKVAELRGNRWNKRVSLRAVKRRRAEHDQGQYLQVRHMTQGVRTYCLAHRLVWLHFMGPIPEGMQINHKNGDKKDNRPGNLELVTASQNARHAYAVGTKDQHGQRNPSAKLTDSQVAAIRLMYNTGHKTQIQIAQQFQVTHQTISKIVRGDRRQKQNGPVQDYMKRRTSRGNKRRDESTGRFS